MLSESKRMALMLMRLEKLNEFSPKYTFRIILQGYGKIIKQTGMSMNKKERQ